MSDVGRLVIGAVAGHGLDAAAAHALESGRLGGLILFRESFSSLRELADLIGEARARAPWPLLVGIDEEGGLVSQLDGVPTGAPAAGPAMGAPSPASLAALGDPTLTAAVHEVVGRLLAALGIDIAFAPVLDVAAVERNPVIGRRAFGSDPKTVTAHGLAALRGLARGGVLSCAKHFPGHGASRADSHVELPVIPGDGATVEARDLAPFRAAVADGVPLVMVAHAHVPALDPQPGPATRSRAIVTGWLRERLGFDGAVVSDALEMRGFGEGAAASVAEALHAGVDGFLVARRPELAEGVVAALAAAAERGDECVRRALDAIERLGRRRLAGAERVDIDRAAADARELLEDVHRRATRLDPNAPRNVDVVVVPDLPPPRHLDPADAAAALCPDGEVRRVVTVSAVRSLVPEDLPERGGALLITLTRGTREAAGTEAAVEALARWSAHGAERSVAIAACADHVRPVGAPDAWALHGLTGSHRSAFEALASRLEAGGAQKSR